MLVFFRSRFSTEVRLGRIRSLFEVRGIRRIETERVFEFGVFN